MPQTDPLPQDELSAGSSDSTSVVYNETWKVKKYNGLRASVGVYCIVENRWNEILSGFVVEEILMGWT